MPDSKITALTALTAADPANDMFPVVDVSDTSMAASGTTKRISINNILACSPSATLASATISGDLGVGTASPSTKLEVATATANTRLRINSTSVVATEYFRSGTGLWLVGSDSTNAFKIARGSNFGGSADYFSIGSATADCTWFDAAGGTRMTLNSGGLAIGTTTNYGKLSVSGSIASFASATIGAVSANSGYVVYSAYAGAGAYISLQPTNSSGTQFEAARIDTNGNLILSSSTVPATLASNYQLTLNATSNTNLRFSYRGSDGVTRVANITLA